MELTPNEMRNQTFASSFRGYSKAEVDAFRNAAASALEEAKVKILNLTEDYESLKQHYQVLKNLEETVKTAMVEAQKSSEQIVINARKEAELIINQAKHHRDQLIGEKHRLLSELEAQMAKMEFTRKSFYNKLRAEMEAHLKLVDSIYPGEQQQDQEHTQRYTRSAPPPERAQPVPPTPDEVRAQKSKPVEPEPVA
ncbi:MAG: DivIVA domain-containing protein, partial [Candidatus Zixiibacteriota bacterium]